MSAMECLSPLGMELQEDERVLQVEAEEGPAAAIEESNRRKLPLELPMPPSFKSLFCKPATKPGVFEHP